MLGWPSQSQKIGGHVREVATSKHIFQCFQAIRGGEEPKMSSAVAQGDFPLKQRTVLVRLTVF